MKKGVKNRRLVYPLHNHLAIELITDETINSNQDPEYQEEIKDEPHYSYAIQIAEPITISDTK